MKGFERLVMVHIDSIVPLQFTYRPNKSTENRISIALHTALTHVEKRNTYVRMLFIDYSSAFNTIVPSKLITKLRTLGLNTSLCNWILDFLPGHHQAYNTSPRLTINTGAHQVWCLVPSCTHCSPTTAWPGMTPTPSLSLQTTQQW